MNRFETIAVEEAEAEAEAALNAEEEAGFMREYFFLKAKQIWPRGTTMRCPRCGRVQTASVGRLATFLEKGWPLCCNDRMVVADCDAPSN